MTTHLDQLKLVTRRQFFGKCAVGIGGVALASLLNERLLASTLENPLAPKQPHFKPRARRAIYLHMAGAPSHLDMFDYKPKLVELNNTDCPESLFKKDRFAFIKGVPKLLGTPHKFARHGQCGMELSNLLPHLDNSIPHWPCRANLCRMELSNLLPHLATIADDITLVRSMHTDQFNHAPAQLFLHTGAPRQGRPGMGAWLTYGLGSESNDLPAFVVLTSGGKTPDGGSSLWGSAFLPTVYQGVQCRSK